MHSHFRLPDERTSHHFAARHVLPALAAAFVLALAPGPAAASEVMDLIGAANTPTPFSARILNSGPEATFYNPTLLLNQKAGVKLSFFYMHMGLNIDYMDRTPGVDITTAAYNSTAADGSPVPAGRLPPTPTSALQKARGSSDPVQDAYLITLGQSLSLVPDRLVLGLLMVVPFTNFQTQGQFLTDEREQAFSNSLHFEMYGDRLKNYFFCIALAGRPVKWMSLGLGLELVFASTTHTRTVVVSNDPAVVPVSTTEASLTAGFSPYAALTFDPIEGLTISTIFHWKTETPAQSQTEQQTWAYDKTGQPFAATYQYDYNYAYNPLRLDLGISWKGKATSRLDYAVAASASWVRWSDYVDRQNERPAQAWSDTFPVTLGTQFTVDGAHDIGLDLTYAQTPVPYQDGRSNYVDNDRFGIATGYQYRFTVKKKYDLSFGVQLQFQHLFANRVVKDAASSNPVVDEFPDSVVTGTDQAVADSAGFQTNNPGWPGYTSSGWLLGAGASFRLQF
jgi:hypothetical protein